MLKILGIILGFFIMVLSVIGLISENEYVSVTPDDLYGPEEMIRWEDDSPQVIPELEAGIGTGYSQDVIVSEGSDILKEDVISGIAADDGFDYAEDVIASEEPDVLAEVFPEAAAGSDLESGILSAGIGAASAEYDPDIISFGDGYYIQIPEVEILADGGDENEYEIMGFSPDQDPAFSIQCITPDHALTLEDLQAICEDLYGGSELVEGSDLTYLTAFDADNQTELCIFASEYSDQIYIIGFTGLDTQQPAKWYFDTLHH